MRDTAWTMRFGGIFFVIPTEQTAAECLRVSHNTRAYTDSRYTVASEWIPSMLSSYVTFTSCCVLYA
jgi:hypothetical protein